MIHDFVGNYVDVSFYTVVNSVKFDSCFMCAEETCVGLENCGLSHFNKYSEADQETNMGIFF